MPIPLQVRRWYSVTPTTSKSSSGGAVRADYPPGGSILHNPTCLVGRLKTYYFAVKLQLRFGTGNDG